MTINILTECVIELLQCYAKTIMHGSVMNYYYIVIIIIVHMGAREKLDTLDVRYFSWIFGKQCTEL